MYARIEKVFLDKLWGKGTVIVRMVFLLAFVYIPHVKPKLRKAVLLENNLYGIIANSASCSCPKEVKVFSS